MIFKFVPLLVIGFLCYLVYRYYRSLAPEQKRPFVVKYAVYAVITLLLLAVVTGRIHWLGAVFAGALGLLKVGANTFFRFLPFLRFFQKNNVFGDPKFRTDYLERSVREESIEWKRVYGFWAAHPQERSPRYAAAEKASRQPKHSRK